MPNDRHLSSIAISRFKGLEELHLEGTGGFNVLLGANNVGKTSILEAIFLLNGFAANQTPIMLQNSRMYLVNSFEDLVYYFHNLDISANIKLSGSLTSLEDRILEISSHSLENDLNLSDQNIRRHTSPDRRIGQALSTTSRKQAWHFNARIIRDGSEDNFEGILDITSHDKAQVQLSIPPNVLTSLSISTVILTPGRGYDTQAISKLIINNDEENLLEALRVIEPRITKITTDGDLAYLNIGLEKMMPINMFGSGMMRAAEILSSCMSGDAQILLIDEIEDGLHFTAIRQLLRVLLKLVKDRQIQIFCSTHSVDVLQGLRAVLQEKQFLDMRPTVSNYVLAKDKDGLIRSYRYDYEQFDHCIEHGIEIR